MSTEFATWQPLENSRRCGICENDDENDGSGVIFSVTCLLFIAFVLYFFLQVVSRSRVSQSRYY